MLNTSTTPPTRHALRPFPAAQALPHLKLGGPISIGFMALAVFAAVAGCLALQIEDVPRLTLAAEIAPPPEPVTLRHGRAGALAQIHVQPGAMVAAGQRLVTFDTRALDDQIAALKLQAEAAKMKLAGIRQETIALGQSEERTASTRQRLSTLERQLAEVEKETIGLDVQIAMAEQDVARAELRAPSAGRITAVHVAKSGVAVVAQAPLIDFAPTTDRVTVEARWSRSSASPKPGAGALINVRLLPANGGRAHNFEGRVAADDDATSPADERVRVTLQPSRAEIELRVGPIAGARAEIRRAAAPGNANRPTAAFLSRFISARS